MAEKQNSMAVMHRTLAMPQITASLALSPILRCCLTLTREHSFISRFSPLHILKELISAEESGAQLL
jgi:hypothetical protein